jgi:ribosomal-protein-alanine N-acetyltransferase
MTTVLATDRLILRTWRDSDREPFAAMNADPEVMRYFPSTLTREESDGQADRIVEKMASRGFGFWAVEIPGVTSFAGFIGVSVPGFDAPLMPCVEIGWRLARGHWGHGYATEGARAALRHGFETLDVTEIVAFTAVGNMRSRRVMDRIGMTRDLDGDFDHPLVPVGHPHRPQVLYRARRA